jgi:hypothetical protein
VKLLTRSSVASVYQACALAAQVTSHGFNPDSTTVVDPVLRAFFSRRHVWLSALAFGGAVALASTGRADDGSGAAGDAGNEPWSDGPPLRPARQVDAHSDRVILMPTAETQPKGMFFVSYGVRLSGPSFAFDLTLVRPFTGGAADTFVLGLPFVVATYRTN